MKMITDLILVCMSAIVLVFLARTLKKNAQVKFWAEHFLLVISFCSLVYFKEHLAGCICVLATLKLVHYFLQRTLDSFQANRVECELQEKKELLIRNSKKILRMSKKMNLDISKETEMFLKECSRTGKYLDFFDIFDKTKKIIISFEELEKLDPQKAEELLEILKIKISIMEAQISEVWAERRRADQVKKDMAYDACLEKLIR